MITKDEFLLMRDGLEMRITAFTISRNEANTDELDLEAALAYTTQFIQNFARQWQDMRDVKQKQRLQKLVLPEGIAYDKTTGKFGTAVLSPIFELNRRFSDDESDLVAGPGIEPGSGGYAYHYGFRRVPLAHAWSGLSLHPAIKFQEETLWLGLAYQSLHLPSTTFFY